MNFFYSFLPSIKLIKGGLSGCLLAEKIHLNSFAPNGLSLINFIISEISLEPVIKSKKLLFIYILLCIRVVTLLVTMANIGKERNTRKLINAMPTKKQNTKSIRAQKTSVNIVQTMMYCQ